MSVPRTKDVDWPDWKHEAGTDRHCVLCQRDIDSGSCVREVLLVDGGERAVHRDDWDLADESDPGYLGIHIVGPSCGRRRVGMMYSRPEERPVDTGGDVECTSCGDHFVSGDALPGIDVVVCPGCLAGPGVGPVGVVR